LLRKDYTQQGYNKNDAKHYVKKGQLDINAWELMAADRQLWRLSIYNPVPPNLRNGR